MKKFERSLHAILSYCAFRAFCATHFILTILALNCFSEIFKNNLFFSVKNSSTLAVHQSSLGLCDSELPYKIGARLVQPFWRLLDANKQTDNQIYMVFSKLCAHSSTLGQLRKKIEGQVKIEGLVIGGPGLISSKFYTFCLNLRKTAEFFHALMISKIYLTNNKEILLRSVALFKLFSRV